MNGPSQASRTAQYLLLALFTAFALLPLFWLFKVSITPDRLMYAEGVRLWPSQMTLDHYRDVIAKTDFPRFFENSVIVSVSTALITTLIASAAGYAFSRFRFRGKGLIVALMLLTQMFPLVMVVAPIFRILSPLHLTNSLSGLVIVYCAFNVPFASFLMQTFFDGIPLELEEAAMLDGASRLHAVLRIVMPLTLPGLAATLGFIFTAAWGELLFALMLNSSASVSTFPVGLLSFVSKFSVDFGQMMAAGCLALLPACAFFVFVQRYLVQGLTAGALKG